MSIYISIIGPDQFYYCSIDFKITHYKILFIIKFYILAMIKLFPTIVSGRWSLRITPFRYEHFYCTRYITISVGFHFSRTKRSMWTSHSAMKDIHASEDSEGTVVTLNLNFCVPLPHVGISRGSSSWTIY